MGSRSGGGSGAGRPTSLAEKLLDLRGVARGHLGVAGEATRHAGRLVLEQVALAGALAEHLAGAGDLEALAGTAVRLVLRHSAVLSSSVALRCPVVKPGTVERRSCVDYFLGTHVPRDHASADASAGASAGASAIS